MDVCWLGVRSESGEREAEAERDGPKSAGEIHASEKLL